jgi:hypothetical protein
MGVRYFQSSDPRFSIFARGRRFRPDRSGKTPDDPGHLQKRLVHGALNPVRNDAGAEIRGGGDGDIESYMARVPLAALVFMILP